MILINDNERDISGPISGCSAGDVVTHIDGSRWEIIATFNKPTYYLKRVGVEHLPMTERDYISVCPDMPIADEFYSLGHYAPDVD